MNACEFLSRSVCVATVLSLGVLAVSPAQAVDLENRDRKEQQVTINRSDGSSETLTLKAGQKLNDICSDCVILLGLDSVEARGRATVKIEGGKVSITSQR